MPGLVALPDQAETDVAADVSFPAAHRATLHRTQPLERLNGQIERRPNEFAITRPVGAILLDQNGQWAVRRGGHMVRETMIEMLAPLPWLCRLWQPEHHNPAKSAAHRQTLEKH